MVDAHSLAHLHDEVDVCSLVNDFVQFHNRWVPQVRQSVDLTVHCVLSLLFLQVLLVVRLYRNDVLRLLMSSSADDSKSTLADL